jgi:hypothetical protein
MNKGRICVFSLSENKCEVPNYYFTKDSTVFYCCYNHVFFVKSEGIEPIEFRMIKTSEVRNRVTIEIQEKFKVIKCSRIAYIETLGSIIDELAACCKSRLKLLNEMENEVSSFWNFFLNNEFIEDFSLIYLSSIGNSYNQIPDYETIKNELLSHLKPIEAGFINPENSEFNKINNFEYSQKKISKCSEFYFEESTKNPLKSPSKPPIFPELKNKVCKVCSTKCKSTDKSCNYCKSLFGADEETFKDTTLCIKCSKELKSVNCRVCGKTQSNSESCIDCKKSLKDADTCSSCSEKIRKSIEWTTGAGISVKLCKNCRSPNRVTNKKCLSCSKVI